MRTRHIFYTIGCFEFDYFTHNLRYYEKPKGMCVKDNLTQRKIKTQRKKEPFKRVNLRMMK